MIPLQEQPDLVGAIDSTSRTLEGFRDYFTTTKQILFRLANAAESHPFTAAELLRTFSDNYNHMADTFDMFAYGLIITCRRSAADLRRQLDEKREHHGPPTADE